MLRIGRAAIGRIFRSPCLVCAPDRFRRTQNAFGVVPGGDPNPKATRVMDDDPLRVFISLRLHGVRAEPAAPFPIGTRFVPPLFEYADKSPGYRKQTVVCGYYGGTIKRSESGGFVDNYRFHVSLSGRPTFPFEERRPKSHRVQNEPTARNGRASIEPKRRITVDRYERNDTR